MTQSINPKIWGAKFWSTMIYVALGYPESPSPQLKRHYENYFRAIAHVLPCESCQQNYQTHIAQHPVNLESQTALLNWLLTIYNLTLHDQKRPPLSDIQSLVNKFTNSKTFNTVSMTLFMICIVMAIVFYYMYQRV
jgi:hypothetical protein